MARLEKVKTLAVLLSVFTLLSVLLTRISGQVNTNVQANPKGVGCSAPAGAYCEKDDSYRDRSGVCKRWGLCNAMIDKCCCNEALVGEETQRYCNFLLEDDIDSWRYPFRGRFPNPSAIKALETQHQFDFRCVHLNFCAFYAKRGNIFKFHPHRDDILGVENRMKNATNRLQFTDQSIAQEGLSFCVVGRHFRRSSISLSPSLRGFLPLAEKSFDIGNHIDPENSEKMNRFELPSPSYFYDLKKFNQYPPDGNWFDRVPSYEFENVLVGLPTSGTYEWTTSSKTELFLYEYDGFMKRPAHPDFQPHKDCKNPYIVKATMIKADGNLLHNYLHIKVFSDSTTNPKNSRCPTGKMKLLMLEVRDQDGYPVGQFTDDIPCDQDESILMAEMQCSSKPCKRWTGTKENHFPCMYTHPKQNVHPSIFMLSAKDASGSGSVGGDSGSGDDKSGSKYDFCRFSWKDPIDRKPRKVTYEENNEDYFTEVHTTWRFAQMNNRWISELHFATLIIEDETPIQYYTGRMSEWSGPRYIHEFPCLNYHTNKDEVRDLLGIGTGRYECNNRTSDETSSSYHDDRYDACCAFWYGLTGGKEVIGRTTFQLALLNRCASKTENTNRPYGYSAKYNAIKPTFKTMGGWDYFQKNYIAPEDVDCHVDITFGPENVYDLKSWNNQGQTFDKLPVRKSLIDFLKFTYKLENTKRYEHTGRKYDYPRPEEEPRYSLRYRQACDRRENQWLNVMPLCDGHKEAWNARSKLNNTYFELADWHTVGASHNTDPDPANQFLFFDYFGTKIEKAAVKMFRSAHQDPAVLKSEFPDYPSKEYFGSQHLLSGYAVENMAYDAVVLSGAHGPEQSQSLEEMAQDPKVRCPCPFIPTNPPPELRTKTSQELDGRQLHVVNEMIAWMILVPLSFFVSRFYKETFSKVFFLQDYWWYTIHYLTLITALVFTLGGIYALKVRRDKHYEYVWTDPTKFHIYGSYVLIGLFGFQLLFGAYRFYNTELRMIQIALHWLFGWLQYSLAVVIILSAAAIPSGTLNCKMFGIYLGFIGFQVLMTLFMEYHHRCHVDKALHLDPPRLYMPPPMMRVFHKDAPYGPFRIWMLVVFFFGSIAFYFALYVTMLLSKAEESCYQPVPNDSHSESIV